jgi:hypothetical protein
MRSVRAGMGVGVASPTDDKMEGETKKTAEIRRNERKKLIYTRSNVVSTCFLLELVEFKVGEDTYILLHFIVGKGHNWWNLEVGKGQNRWNVRAGKRDDNC